MKEFFSVYQISPELWRLIVHFDFIKESWRAESLWKRLGIMKRLKYAVLVILTIYFQVSQGCERKEIIKSRPAHCPSRHRGKCYQSQLREDHLWTKLERENFRFKADSNVDEDYRGSRHWKFEIFFKKKRLDPAKKNADIFLLIFKATRKRPHPQADGYPMA